MVFKQLITLYAFLLVGFVLSKLNILPNNTPSVLSKLETWVFLACVNIKNFSAQFNKQYISSNYHYLIISVIILIFTVPISTLIAKCLNKDKYEQKVYAYTLTVPNYGFLGYAIIEGLYGSEMLLNMMVFVLPLSVYVYTEGYRNLTMKEKISFKSLINPLIVSVLLGVVIGFFEIPLPEFLNEIISKSANCMAPCAMILTGAVISHFKISDIVKDYKIYIISVIRLLLIPAILFLILKLLSVDKNIIIVVLITYSMPAGLNPVVFSGLIGKDSKSGAGLALVSNVLLLATLPIITKVLESI